MCEAQTSALTFKENLPTDELQTRPFLGPSTSYSPTDALRGPYVQVKGPGRETHFHAPKSKPIVLLRLILTPVTYLIPAEFLSNFINLGISFHVNADVIGIGGIPDRGVRVGPDSVLTCSRRASTQECSASAKAGSLNESIWTK